MKPEAIAVLPNIRVWISSTVIVVHSASALAVNEERQVSMVITQGLRSRKLAASACGVKMAKLGSTRDVAPRWDPRA